MDYGYYDYYYYGQASVMVLSKEVRLASSSLALY